jgi:hypothetical protein
LFPSYRLREWTKKGRDLEKGVLTKWAKIAKKWSP